MRPREACPGGGSGRAERVSANPVARRAADEKTCGVITVRSLDSDEWPIWRGLRLRALEDSPEAFGSTLAEVIARDTEHYWRQGVSPPMVPFVAEVDGAPAGMARLMFPDHPDRAELVSVWVAPEARDRGVGHALVASGIDHLAAHHPLTRLRLAVVETNMPARRLYEGCGFAVIGRNPDDDAELLMERPAPASASPSSTASASGSDAKPGA